MVEMTDSVHATMPMLAGALIAYVISKRFCRCSIYVALANNYFKESGDCAHRCDAWIESLAIFLSRWILQSTSLIDILRTTCISQADNRSAKCSARTCLSVHDRFEKKVPSRSLYWSVWSRNLFVLFVGNDVGPIWPSGDVSAIMGDFLSCWETSTPLALFDKALGVPFHSNKINLKRWKDCFLWHLSLWWHGSHHN